MIALSIILALSAIFIAALVFFWRDIVEWIKKATNKIKEVLGIAAKGTKTFVEKTADGLKNKSKYYYQNKTTQEWEEVVYTKPITDENEIPPELLAKVRNASLNDEVSSTEELRLAISA